MTRLSRIILYVRDVERLSEFYRQAFSFPLVQHIPGEWAVLRAGECELALLQAGAAYTPPQGWSGDNNNAKLVFTIDLPIADVRDALIARGVSMGTIKQYPGLTGPLCDGKDPEGNVFQLAQAASRELIHK